MKPSITWTSAPGPYVMGMVAVGGRLVVAKAGYRISAGAGTAAEEHAATVVFLSRSTGEILTSIPLDEPESVSPLCRLPDRGVVLTMRSGDGIEATALDPDGNTLWRCRLESEREIAPVAADRSAVLIPLASRTGFTGIACLDATEGKVRWQAPARSRPIVDGKGRCVFVDARRRIVAVSVESGKELFASDQDGFVHAFLVSDRIYGMLETGEAHPISAPSGAVGVPQRWASSAPEIVSMSFGDFSTFISTESEIRSIPLVEGGASWRIKATGRNDLFEGFDDHLYVSGRETIMALEAGSGREAWRMSVPGTVVAIESEDRRELNVATFEGAVFGIRVAGG